MPWPFWRSKNNTQATEVNEDYPLPVRIFQDPSDILNVSSSGGGGGGGGGAVTSAIQDVAFVLTDATIRSARGLVVYGRSSDATPAYKEIPLGLVGRAVYIEGRIPVGTGAAGQNPVLIGGADGSGNMQQCLVDANGSLLTAFGSGLDSNNDAIASQPSSPYPAQATFTLNAEVSVPFTFNLKSTNGWLYDTRSARFDIENKCGKTITGATLSLQDTIGTTVNVGPVLVAPGVSIASGGSGSIVFPNLPLGAATATLTLALPVGAATGVKTIITQGRFSASPSAFARSAQAVYRSSDVTPRTAADVLGTAVLPTLADQNPGGSSLAGGTYIAAVSAGKNGVGNSPSSPITAGVVLTLNHVGRVTVTLVTSADYYDFFFSLSTTSPPLWVARVSSAQVIAGTAQINAVGVVTTVAAHGANTVDFAVAGTGQASGQPNFSFNNAYLLSGIPVIDCRGYDWLHVWLKLTVDDLRTAPIVNIMPFFQSDLVGTDWYAGDIFQSAIGRAEGYTLNQLVSIEVTGHDAVLLAISTLIAQMTGSNGLTITYQLS